MRTSRAFVDTVFIQGLISVTDQHHRAAVRLRPMLDTADLWTTEAVLIEVGNAFAASNRAEAAAFIDRIFRTANIHVESVTTPLLLEALSLYRSRPDKEWGLTDCISFMVMSREGIRDALTTDRHFVQAGFRALMLEEP